VAQRGQRVLPKYAAAKCPFDMSNFGTCGVLKKEEETRDGSNVVAM